MGLYFRKSKRLASGLRLNVSTRGLGLSAGPRGAKASLNTRREKGLFLGALGFFWRRRWR